MIARQPIVQTCLQRNGIVALSWERRYDNGRQAKGGVTEIAEFRRGPGGRPTRVEAERRHGAMLEAAMRLFLARGFEAVSIEEIAKQAGVAKRFIYARYGDKSELFVAAIEHSFLSRLETLYAIEPSPRGAEEGLYQLGQVLVRMSLQPDVVALRRLIFAAAPQFPGIAKRLFDRNRDRAFREVERFLKYYADRGEIEFIDAQPHIKPYMMAEQFFISVAGIPQRLALLGMNETPEDEDRRLRLAVRLFVNGCRAPQAHASKPKAKR
jgi:TetR/AcrR family transcriptional regulator, mexJK operon transcriptional repressor